MAYGPFNAGSGGGGSGSATLIGSTAPTTATVGKVGQSYLNTTTGTTYTCIAVNNGVYTWIKSGATAASMISCEDGEGQTTDLASMLSALSEAVDSAKPLSGDTDPTSSTKGAVGQTYTNTATGQIWTCIAADDEEEVYTWEISGGSGSSLKLNRIYIDTPPTKTAYKAGEVFAPAGMVVKADYALDGVVIVTGQVVTGYSYDQSALAAGTTSVTITYSEGGVTKTATQAISVTKTQVPVPTYSGSLTYDGSEKTPTFTNDPGALATKGGDTSATDAGNYSTTFTLVNTDYYEWASTFSGSVAWSIAQADSGLAVNPSSVTLNSSNLTAQVAITTNSDGALSQESSDSGVATASISGKTATISNVNETSGAATITIKQAATKNYKAGTATIAVMASFIAITGVCWTWSNSSTALSRLTPSNDPNGLVNTAIASEPVPAVGTGSGSSPCDNIEPWASMYECNHSGTAVTYKKGQSGFSRTGADTVIWIPEYYCKVVNDTANSKTYYYLASGAVSGFTKMEGSGKFVGRYKTGSGYVSKSGVAPQVSMTRATCRTQSKAKGGKWRMNDYATWCAYTYLYLVEFADWDSQTKLGKGYTDGNSAAINTGGTDSMTYHTGRAAGTDGKTSVQYRGIEDPFGNVYEWVDGINFLERKAYVCTDPSKYADDTSSGYTDTGVTLCSSAWIKKLTPSTTVAWAFFLPTEGGGSNTTYIPDYVYSNAGWCVLRVGGDWSNGLIAGLFYFYAGSGSSGSDTSIGARLLVDP